MAKGNGPGGYRPGAGRKKGSLSAKTREIAEAVILTGATPLEFLLSAMNDESREFPVRLDAAKAAAPYVHPRLANIEANVTVTGHEAALAELE